MVRPPLTERILRRLRGPRWLWVLAWAAVYPAAVEVIPSAPPLMLPPDARLRFYAFWVLAVIATTWGSRLFYREVNALQPLLNELLPESGDPGTHPFREMGSTVGALAFAFLNAAVFSGPELVRSPGAAGAALFAANLIGGIPALTFLWLYVALFVGLNRLSRSQLALRPFQVDRSLGLAPLGALAFNAFLFLAPAAALLTVFGGTPDVRSTVFSLAIILGGSVLLFISLSGMHRQLIAAKARHLADVRRLYAQAYGTFDRPISLEALSGRAAVLNAVEAQERRAEAIQEWPLSEGLIARFAAIVTGLTAAVLARFLLSRVGL